MKITSNDNDNNTLSWNVSLQEEFRQFFAQRIRKCCQTCGTIGYSFIFTRQCYIEANTRYIHSVYIRGSSQGTRLSSGALRFEGPRNLWQIEALIRSCSLVRVSYTSRNVKVLQSFPISAARLLSRLLVSSTTIFLFGFHLPCRLSVQRTWTRCSFFSHATSKMWRGRRRRRGWSQVSFHVIAEKIYQGNRAHVYFETQVFVSTISLLN